MPWKSKVTSLRAPETPNVFTDGANLGARGKNNQGWVPCVRGDKGGEREESGKMRGMYKHRKWREGGIKELLTREFQILFCVAPLCTREGWFQRPAC